MCSKLEMERLEGLREISELKNQLENSLAAQESYKNLAKRIKVSSKQ